MDDEALMKLLRKNSDKNFVRRILNPEAFPSLEEDGTRMSHLMEYGEADGRYYVYPRIAYERGELKNYGDEAFDRAMRTGDFMSFDTEDEASWFSRNYKNVWPKELR